MTKSRLLYFLTKPIVFLVRRTCLKPNYSLQRQLFLSFGLAVVLTITLVVGTACVTAVVAGRHVKSSADDVLKEQVEQRLIRNSQLVATTVAAYFENIEGILALESEAVQDRIVGYPLPGWEEDLYVPFIDRETGANMYPLKAKPVQLDWMVKPNINSSNAQEHFPGKAHLYPVIGRSYQSSEPDYFMPGSCDPLETDESSKSYLPNCTDANNDVATGGIFPTPTHKGLYEKSADLAVVLKSLCESNQEIFATGYHFINSGVSTLFDFPGANAGDVLSEYVSDGCDWMSKINPHNGKPFGTKEEMQRCNPKGTKVAKRMFNSNERSWFSAYINSLDASWAGPFNFVNNVPIFVVGKPVFDRITGNLICVSTVGVFAETLHNILRSSASDDDAELFIIRYRDDTVFASSIHDDTSPQNITKSGFVSTEVLEQLRKTVDYTGRSLDVIVSDAKSYTAYPLPALPVNHAIDAHPEYLLIRAIPNDVFDLSNLDDAIRTEVAQVWVVSALIGVGGIAVVLLIVWLVSRALTKPLLWIKQVAWQVVNRMGESKFAVATDVSRPPLMARTEVDDLVSAFKEMFHAFGGKHAAIPVEHELHEIPNRFEWNREYEQLLSKTSTGNDSIDDVIETAKLLSEEAALALPSSSGRMPEEALSQPRKHSGENIRFSPKENMSQLESPGFHVSRTSLFIWILFLIVFPFLVTNGTISAVVSDHIVNSLGTLVVSVGHESTELEVKAVQSRAVLSAFLAGLTVGKKLQDLYIMTRIAGWLFYDGVSRSTGFTTIDEIAQVCRVYERGTCPLESNFDRTLCACRWKDIGQEQCVMVNHTDPRNLQRKLFFCQARDSNNVTGDRHEAASFGQPGIDDSPGTTLFWDDIDSVPGSSKGVNASGYYTTYDRIRVSSALSMIEIPMYNYMTQLGRRKHFLTSYLAFEADGMMSGYKGCQQSFSAASIFQSNEYNGAAEIDPKLCPLGKFGYDPRCREWYDTGRRLYHQSRRASYITNPYLTAGGYFAAAATAPVANPATNEYLGQMLLDFSPTKIMELLSDVGNGMGFIMTPFDNTDSIVLTLGDDEWEPVSVKDYLFEFDKGDVSVYIQNFEKAILNKMTAGETGYETFTRSTSDGGEESLIIAFAPVKAMSLLPLDPSDFSRGVNQTLELVYSIGMIYRADEFDTPWEIGKDELDEDIARLLRYYFSAIVLISFCCLIVAITIDLSITKPVIALLHVVRRINNGNLASTLPLLNNGPAEIQQVHVSISRLWRVVRISTNKYNAGNLNSAYRITKQALDLYRQMDNRKAIGIACNNLGNILHSLLVSPSGEPENDCCNRFSGGCLVEMAKGLYDESICIANFQLENATNKGQVADLRQQLADRLFNRSLFLLLVADEACAPIDCRQTALCDIQQVHKLDLMAQVSWEEQDVFGSRSPEMFDRLLRRCSGLLRFYGDTELVATWNPEAIIKEAEKMLSSVWDQPVAPLFESIRQIGRLQQLERVAMWHDMVRGKPEFAARLAIRSFMEDEFILEDSFAASASVWMKFVRDYEFKKGSSTAVTQVVRKKLESMLPLCKHIDVDLGKSVLFAVLLSNELRGSSMLKCINTQCLRMYDEYCRNEDSVGIVGYTSEGVVTVPVVQKADNGGRLRSGLDFVTKETPGQSIATFPRSLQNLSPTGITGTSSFIVLITSGTHWESETGTAVQETLRAALDAKINVIVLGVRITNDTFAEFSETMRSVSGSSGCFSINETNVESTIAAVCALIWGEPMPRPPLQGMTMEQF